MASTSPVCGGHPSADALSWRGGGVHRMDTRGGPSASVVTLSVYRRHCSEGWGPLSGRAGRLSPSVAASQLAAQRASALGLALSGTGLWQGWSPGPLSFPLRALWRLHVSASSARANSSGNADSGTSSNSSSRRGRASMPNRRGRGQPGAYPLRPSLPSGTPAAFPSPSQGMASESLRRPVSPAASPRHAHVTTTGPVANATAVAPSSVPSQTTVTLPPGESERPSAGSVGVLSGAEEQGILEGDHLRSLAGAHHLFPGPAQEHQNKPRARTSPSALGFAAPAGRAKGVAVGGRKKGRGTGGRKKNSLGASAATPTASDTNAIAHSTSTTLTDGDAASTTVLTGSSPSSIDTGGGSILQALELDGAASAPTAGPWGPQEPPSTELTAAPGVQELIPAAEAQGSKAKGVAKGRGRKTPVGAAETSSSAYVGAIPEGSSLGVPKMFMPDDTSALTPVQLQSSLPLLEEGQTKTPRKKGVGRARKNSAGKTAQALDSVPGATLEGASHGLPEMPQRGDVTKTEALGELVLPSEDSQTVRKRKASKSEKAGKRAARDKEGQGQGQASASGVPVAPPLEGADLAPGGQPLAAGEHEAKPPKKAARRGRKSAAAASHAVEDTDDGSRSGDVGKPLVEGSLSALSATSLLEEPSSGVSGVPMPATPAATALRAPPAEPSSSALAEAAQAGITAVGASEGPQGGVQLVGASGSLRKEVVPGGGPAGQEQGPGKWRPKTRWERGAKAMAAVLSSLGLQPPAVGPQERDSTETEAAGFHVPTPQADKHLVGPEPASAPEPSPDPLAAQGTGAPAAVVVGMGRKLTPKGGVKVASALKGVGRAGRGGSGRKKKEATAAAGTTPGVVLRMSESVTGVPAKRPGQERDTDAGKGGLQEGRVGDEEEGHRGALGMAWEALEELQREGAVAGLGKLVAGDEEGESKSEYGSEYETEVEDEEDLWDVLGEEPAAAEDTLSTLGTLSGPGAVGTSILLSLHPSFSTPSSDYYSGYLSVGASMVEAHAFTHAAELFGTPSAEPVTELPNSSLPGSPAQNKPGSSAASQSQPGHSDSPVGPTSRSVFPDFLPPTVPALPATSQPQTPALSPSVPPPSRSESTFPDYLPPPVPALPTIRHPGNAASSTAGAPESSSESPFPDYMPPAVPEIPGATLPGLVATGTSSASPLPDSLPSPQAHPLAATQGEPLETPRSVSSAAPRSFAAYLPPSVPAPLVGLPVRESSSPSGQPVATPPSALEPLQTLQPLSPPEPHSTPDSLSSRELPSTLAAFSALEPPYLVEHKEFPVYLPPLVPEPLGSRAEEGASADADSVSAVLAAGDAKGFPELQTPAVPGPLAGHASWESTAVSSPESLSSVTAYAHHQGAPEDPLPAVGVHMFPSYLPPRVPQALASLAPFELTAAHSQAPLLQQRSYGKEWGLEAEDREEWGIESVNDKEWGSVNESAGEWDIALEVGSGEEDEGRISWEPHQVQGAPLPQLEQQQHPTLHNGSASQGGEEAGGRAEEGVGSLAASGPRFSGQHQLGLLTDSEAVSLLKGLPAQSHTGMDEEMEDREMAPDAGRVRDSGTRAQSGAQAQDGAGSSSGNRSRTERGGEGWMQGQGWGGGEGDGEDESGSVYKDVGSSFGTSDSSDAGSQWGGSSDYNDTDTAYSDTDTGFDPYSDLSSNRKIYGGSGRNTSSSSANPSGGSGAASSQEASGDSTQESLDWVGALSAYRDPSPVPETTWSSAPGLGGPYSDIEDYPAYVAAGAGAGAGEGYAKAGSPSLGADDTGAGPWDQSAESGPYGGSAGAFPWAEEEPAGAEGGEERGEFREYSGDDWVADAGIPPEYLWQVQQLQGEYGRVSSALRAKGEAQDEFLNAANKELQRISRLLDTRELELNELKEELMETKAQLAIMQSRAEAELSLAKHQLLEKDAQLRTAEAAMGGLEKVTLEYWGAGTTIELAGSFNGWQHHVPLRPDPSSEIPSPDGARGPMMWDTTLWLYPGIYEIKFIVDGHWMVDQRREVVQHGSQNNILRVEKTIPDTPLSS